jgi:shikimate dehydrogenase
MSGRVIDGATKVLGIVGDPIAQVRSPIVWNGLFRRHRLNMACVPFHVLPENLAGFFAGLRTMKNLMGTIVTIPHKRASADLVDALTPRAARVRSVNFIAVGPDGRFTGDIVDGFGFIANLKAHGADPRGRRALLVGAGGVGTAIAFALVEAGVGELVIHDIDPERGASLAARLAGAGPAVRAGPPDPAGFDLVVNASPAGMRADDPLPVDPERIAKGAVVADVVVHETELLRRAAARGCLAVDGTGMTDQQVAVMAAQLGLGALDFSAGAALEIASAPRAGA